MLLKLLLQQQEAGNKVRFVFNVNISYLYLIYYVAEDTDENNIIAKAEPATGWTTGDTGAGGEEPFQPNITENSAQRVLRHCYRNRLFLSATQRGRRGWCSATATAPLLQKQEKSLLSDLHRFTACLSYTPIRARLSELAALDQHVARTVLELLFRSMKSLSEDAVITMASFGCSC